MDFSYAASDQRLSDPVMEPSFDLSWAGHEVIASAVAKFNIGKCAPNCRIVAAKD
jgi:hypothetical protein